MTKHIIRIHCSDQKGLIYKITETLFGAGLNIISNAEHVDPDMKRFFMRTEIEGTMDHGALTQELVEKLPSDANISITRDQKKRLAVLVTKESHCIGDLLVRSAYNEMNAEILEVLGNHDTLKPLVEKFEIPFHLVSHVDKSREEQEGEVIDHLRRIDPDYIVLAKYMRILSPQFVEAFPDKIINIHHSFLPAFIGAKPYQQAHDRGVKIVGATAHFVNDQLDEGPIIAQGVIPVTHAHSSGDMASAGRDVEKITLAKALKLVLEDRVFVHANRTVIFE